MPHSRVGTLAFALLVLASKAFAQQAASVECEAILIEYQDKYWWTEQYEDRIDEYISQFATFEIQTPIEFSGRRVRIIFLGSEFDGLLPESNGATGERYEIELPAEYFDGPDGRVIRDSSVLSFERSERQE